MCVAFGDKNPILLVIDDRTRFTRPSLGFNVRRLLRQEFDPPQI